MPRSAAHISKKRRVRQLNVKFTAGGCSQREKERSVYESAIYFGAEQTLPAIKQSLVAPQVGLGCNLAAVCWGALKLLHT